MLRLKKVHRLSLVAPSNDVIDFPAAATVACRDPNTVAHHARLVALDYPTVAIQSIPEDPCRTPVRQRDGICRVRAPPRVFERKVWGALDCGCLLRAEPSGEDKQRQNKGDKGPPSAISLLGCDSAQILTELLFC